VFEDASYDIIRSLDVTGLWNGKLIVWHGWHDELVTALRTQEYVDTVQQRFGAESASTFMRAYFVPAMNHCRGGVGPVPDEYEVLSNVVDWVERGTAPHALVLHVQRDGALHSIRS
jgi:hypothetical protein